MNLLEDDKPQNEDDEANLPDDQIEQSLQLTEEQLERIKINKERAEKLRLERLKKAQDKAFFALTIDENQLSSQDLSTNCSNSIIVEKNEEMMQVEEMLDEMEQNTDEVSQKSKTDEVLETVVQASPDIIADSESMI